MSQLLGVGPSQRRGYAVGQLGLGTFGIDDYTTIPAFSSEKPAPVVEDPQEAFRRQELAGQTTVAGSGYVARIGDSISRVLGSSSPQAIGNFMRANDLESDRIEAGRNYFVPDDVTAYGDATAEGQFALNQGNARAVARNEMQGELNHSAAMNKLAGEPEWSFREAGMAQRRLEDAQALQARLADGPQMTSGGGVSVVDRLNAAAATIDAIKAGPGGAMGYLVGSAIGLSESDKAGLAVVGATAGELLSLRAGVSSTSVSAGWERPKGWRLPVNAGEWTGLPGDSGWLSTKPSVIAITGGEPVPFVKGYPDFGKWSSGTVQIEGLTGKRADLSMAYQAVAREFGLATAVEAKNLLRELEVSPHHLPDGRTIQLVPTPLNQIPHVGGAANLRNGK